MGLPPQTPQHAAKSHHRGMFATAPAAALVRGATAPHPATIGRVTPRRCSVPRWQFSTSGPSAIRFRWSRIAEDPFVSPCSALHYTAALRSNRYLLAAMQPAGFFIGWRLVDGETHFPHPYLFCALRIDFTEIERGRSVSGCPSGIGSGFLVCLRQGASLTHPHPNDSAPFPLQKRSKTFGHPVGDGWPTPFAPLPLVAPNAQRVILITL